MTRGTIRQGDILTTPTFAEPMRVVTEPRAGNGYIIVDLVGTRTPTFRGGVVLTAADLEQIQIVSSQASFQETHRLPHTVPFELVGEELALYQAVTWYVITQSRRAADQGDDQRARAIRFLMAMYQRRMASSTYALKESLRRRKKKLHEELETIRRPEEIPVPELPSDDDWEEMDAAAREEPSRGLRG